MLNVSIKYQGRNMTIKVTEFSLCSGEISLVFLNRRIKIIFDDCIEGNFSLNSNTATECYDFMNKCLNEDRFCSLNYLDNHKVKSIIVMRKTYVDKPRSEWKFSKA